jgi:hypothetical protein
MTTRVIHHRDIQSFYRDQVVWIDRHTKWGNPFPLVPGLFNREAVIVQYEAWVTRQPELMAALGELWDKVLVCHCKPKACHGDVLVKLLQEAGLE